jgi:uncharacterized Zn finger protein
MVCDAYRLNGERKGKHMAETINEKALRLINGGAVTVRFFGDYVIDADVQGDHGKYPVVVEVGESVRCWCPATGDCSHMVAVLAVALERRIGLPVAVALR